MRTPRIVVFLRVPAPSMAGSPGAHADSSGALSYAGFEGETNVRTGHVLSADAAGGDREARVIEGELCFEPGKGGNAVLVGDGAARVQYSAEKNILPEQGTLEFLLCSKDWEFHDGEYHVFFEADGAEVS